jgi:hypothetical protein
MKNIMNLTMDLIMEQYRYGNILYSALAIQSICNDIHSESKIRPHCAGTSACAVLNCMERRRKGNSGAKND